MPTPSPRKKILPARGAFSNLLESVADILDGEICYATDQDQYYQKEGDTLVSVGATKAQGAKADTALQPGDNLSELVDDIGLVTDALQPGDNVSELVNDAGYLTEAIQAGDNISELVNDAGYITAVDLPAVNYPVTSVNTKTGDVVLATDDVSDSTSTNKYVKEADLQKLGGIEDNATADQTAEEIKALYESNADTNAFTDASQTKLSGIEDNATADQTGAEIKVAYEAEPDTNAFTDADKSKLDGVEDGATADLTGDEVKSLYEANFDTNAFTDADKLKLDSLPADAEPNAVTSVAGKTGAVSLDSSDVGLGLADNTSDADKPVSTATQSALDLKADLVNGVIPTSQIPALAITEFLGEVANETEMIALDGQPGDWCFRSDDGHGYVIVAEPPTDASNWQEIATPGGAVSSVNDQTGTVVLGASDVGAATAAQGALASTALQPGDNVSQLINDSGYITSFDITSQTDPKYLRSNASDTATGVYTFSTISSSPTLDMTGTYNGGTGYNYFLRAANDATATGAVFFINGSTRADDGGPNTFTIRNDGGALRLGKTSTATLLEGSSLTYNSNTVWHAGNDGSGSGLDADLLDGVQGSSFLRSDAADSFSGNLTNAGSNYITFGPNATWSRYLRVGGNGYQGSATTANIATTNGNLHLDAAAGTFVTYLNYYGGTGGVSFGSGASSVVAFMGPDGDLWKGSADNTGSKYWHAGNDGSGSGLDADLLDGVQGSSFLRSDANDTSSGTIAFGTGNLDPDSFGSFSGGFGKIQDGAWGARGLFVHGGGTGDAAAIAHNGSNLYFGVQNGASASSMETWLRVTPGTRVINFTTANDTDNVQIGGSKIWHAGNDGSGSGLDADTLDGVQASQFLRSDVYDESTAGLRIRRDNSGTEPYIALDIENTATSAGMALDCQADGGKKYEIQADVQGRWFVYDRTANQYRLTIDNNGVLKQGSTNVIWHQGNDGAGSGLDADLLDGVQGSNYLRSNTSDTFSGGTLTVNGGSSLALKAESADFGEQLEIHRNSTQSPSIKFTNDSGQVGILYADPSAQNLIWRNGTTSNNYEVWHSGNDGLGSGLDADKLDGAQPSVSASNNTIVKRHASGYIYANYFNTTPNDVSSGITKVCVETSNDGFIRHGTASGVRSFLGVSESMYVCYHGSGNQALTTTSTKVDLAGVLIVTSNDFSVNSSGIAVNSTGVYQISVDLQFNKTANTGQSTARFYIAINDVEYGHTNTYAFLHNPSHGETGASRTILQNLVAGDRVSVYASINSGANAVQTDVMKAYSSITIVRVG